MPNHDSNSAPLELRIPWVTLLKAGVAVGAAVACVRLWPAAELLLFASLIAIALSPVVRALERRRISRGRAVVLVALAVVLGDLRHEGRHDDLPRAPEVDGWLARPLSWGPPAFKAAAAGVVVAVLSLYLLLDGPEVVAWLLAYAPRAHRRRMGDMVPELFSVVQAYTTGQLIASCLFGTFVFVSLTATGVPGALPFALFAAFCDAIPVAGITAVTALSALSALSVGPTTALLVGALFVGYHLFELYVLLPRLYGNRLRLSTLTVLLAILGGGTLGGIPGAVLALPLVAAYPVIEKHWLDDWLHPDVVEDHSALRETEDEGRHQKLVAAVLEGRRIDSRK